MNPGVATLHYVARAAKFALDLAIPIICVHCAREGDLLCDRCIASVRHHKQPLCPKCAEPVLRRNTLCGDCTTLPPPLDRFVSAYPYDGAIRSAAHAFKYRETTALASRLSELMIDTGFIARALRIDCIVPVPMHSAKLRERGYNQSVLLARQIAAKSRIRLVEDALIKTRPTESQVRLTRQQRIDSLRGVFRANYSFADAHVLIVDDVSTTGSTLMNCASALKKAGAQRVSAIALAKEIGTPSRQRISSRRAN